MKKPDIKKSANEILKIIKKNNALNIFKVIVNKKVNESINVKTEIQKKVLRILKN